MPASSLWHPWTSLIYDERKTIEIRHWEMLHRGPLAIHAAMKVDKDACEEFGYHPVTITRGNALYRVEVTGCVRFPHPARCQIHSAISRKADWNPDDDTEEIRRAYRL